jgi:hypothetical protein
MTLRELIQILNSVSVNDKSSDDILNAEVKVKVDRFVNVKDTAITVSRMPDGKPNLITILATHDED